MASGTYPFIDIAVLDEIRERFANGDALVVISPDLQNVIWANGQGASMLGYGSIDEILGGGAVLGIQAQRQLMALDGFPAIGHGRTVSLRVAFGLSSRILTFQASDLALPRGEEAILLSIANSDLGASSEKQIAALAIKGFGDQATHAAMIDASGAVIAASQQFGRLEFNDKILGDLVREVRLERNRLVKRPVRTAKGAVPTGIARLTDSPALHLLFAIEPEVADEQAKEIVAVDDVPPELAVVPEAPIADEQVDDAAARTEDEPQASLAFAPSLEATGSTTEKSGTFQYVPSEAPVRFVWKVDALANFSEISPEFAAAVGPQSASIIGRPFREVAASRGLDDNEEIAELLERRDTWSGRTVLWPIEGTDLRVPIELAALPIYSRDRAFLGFRGFGVARMGDVTVDPKAAGKTLNDNPAVDVPTADAVADVFNGEKPVLEITPDTTDNIIPLKTQRPLRDDGRLNDAERNAFREIAEAAPRSAGG